MRRYTLTLNDDLMDHLWQRAAANHRNLNGEITHLITTALSIESEHTQKALGLIKLLLSEQEPLTPVQIGTGVLASES